MIAGVLPALDPRPGFARGALKVQQRGRRIAASCLPLLLAVFIAKLERRRSERAFAALVLPDTHLDRTVAELLDGLLSGVVGGSGILVRFCASGRLRHGNLHCKRGLVSISWRASKFQGQRRRFPCKADERVI